ncbi:MAG: deoxyribodipyrimidine photo-lyase [Pseudomonadota bacterium]
MDNTTSPQAIFWFRQDLRLKDNPGLNAATQAGMVLPIYIDETPEAGQEAMGGASRVWVHHSLSSLNKSLGGNLSLYRGRAETIIKKLCETYTIKQVFWNRCYEPWRKTRDTHLKKQLTERSITATSFNGSLLWEPWTIRKPDDTPYRVFTPFYQKGCLNAPPPRIPVTALKTITLFKDTRHSIELDALGFLPGHRWQEKIITQWTISEAGAHKQLAYFMKNSLAHYKKGRDLPAKPWVSRLSPYLHFGEISVHQVWYAALAQGLMAEPFCRELGWREFSYHLLYSNPNLRTKNLQPKFDDFPWRDDPDDLAAWQQGLTGIPMVDAGMHELWATGYMHNRVRMIVGSFLVKNLRLDWRHGERWFWDCLVDADLANNSASWQWIAGCGADAAPYFRVFNPVTQAQKFDPDGVYIHTHLPELANLAPPYLFAPWDAPPQILQAAGVMLGTTYPHPIIDLKKSREEALAAFAEIKTAAP